MWTKSLSVVNASLNATAGILLFLGWVAIKRGRRDIHKRLMITALGVSGKIYFLGALAAGVYVLRMSYEFIRSQTMLTAKNLLKATVIYLPVLLILIVIDGIF